MAFPVYVGATAQQTVTTSPTSVSLPSGVQVGDLLFAMATMGPAPSNSLNLPAGWVLQQQNTDNQFREKLVLASFVHDGSANYSFSSTHWANARIRLIAYRGQAASNPINASAIVYSEAAGATLASAAIAAAAGLDAIEVCFAADLDNRNTTVSGSGVTSRLNSATWLSFDIADSNATAGINTSAKTFTWGFSGTKRTIINVVVSGTAPAATAVSFNGTVNGQTATVGSAFNLDLSAYFTGNMTPFTYSLVAGSLSGTGLSLNTSTGVISSTPSAVGTISGLQVRATDSASNNAQTNAFSITVAAAPQVPQGTFTVGSISVGQTTASVPYMYSAGDATSIQYRLGGTGTPQTASASPLALSGLNAGTQYSIQFRAVNASGPQLNWSTAVSFTTSSVPGPIATFTTGALTDLNGVVQANKSLLYLAAYNKTTGQLVFRKTTGLTTDTNGRCTISDAALTQGQEYRWDWETAEGHRCMPLGTAQ